MVDLYLVPTLTGWEDLRADLVVMPTDKPLPLPRTESPPSSQSYRHFMIKLSRLKSHTSKWYDTSTQRTLMRRVHFETVRESALDLNLVSASTAILPLDLSILNSVRQYIRNIPTNYV